MTSQFFKRALLFIMVIFIFQACENVRPEKRILIFTKTAGYYHKSIPVAVEAITKMVSTEGMKSDTTTNAAYFHEDSLKKYSAVMFLNTTGDVLNYRQQADFERYIQSGGGFIGVHAASDTEYQWPWFGHLLGAYFESHPKQQTALVKKTNIQHTATAHLEDQWERYDEWYNFKSLSSDNQVMLHLDESTYEGGTHGDFHPLSWFKEFNGGRSFYTGMGHTEESYSEEAFMQHVLEGIKYAIGDNHEPDYSKVTSLRVPDDENFVKVVLDEKLNEPMELSVLPDGKIVFVERRGAVKLYLPEKRETKQLAQINVYDGYEDGLLGLTRDPDFQDNGWIYLYYSPKGPDSVQRLSRFTIQNDSLLMNSEAVLLEIPSQREECCHSAGSMAFGPDGLLYLALGDNSNPLTFTHYDRSQLFVPHDERKGRKNWDSQRTSGNANDLRGGIIRIKPEMDGTYSIPEGNLYPEGDSLSRAEIYVQGARNPFRISVDQKKNYLYYGEVGPDTGADSERGPKGYDEFNQVRSAGFYGWPYFTANNIPYVAYNWETKELGETFDPENPANNSVNNTGRTQLPPAVPAMIWYPYEVSKEFPLLGEGGRNAMAGPVYYSDSYPETRRKFPNYYDGKLFIYEWMRNWIMAVTFDENDSLQKIEPFLPELELQSPMDMEFGPDGALYMLEYGTNWFTGNDDARLIRIDYNDKNRLPVAIAESDNPIGAVPLKVQFSAEDSYDFDKEDEISYEWSLIEPQNLVIGSDEKISHTFEKEGIYKIQLKVTDSKGEFTTTEIAVMAGNQRPNVNIDINGNKTFYWANRTLDYHVSVDDKEDGSIGSGISEDSVVFTINYIAAAEGDDGGHKINVIPFKKGLDLIEGSDCRSCHQRDQSSVGPSYLAIASRYKGQKEALQSLADKVINGGGGNWGEHSMAAHPQITQDQAKQMVQYILSQTNEVKGREPLKGAFKLDEHLKSLGGIYHLSAVYPDKGSELIPPLTGKKEMIMRPLKVEAEDCDSYDGVSKNRPSSTNYMRISPLKQNAWVMFNDIDLSSISAYRCRVSAEQEGGVLEIRSGSEQGKLLSSLKIPSTANELKWVEISGKIDAIESEMDDLYLIFKHENPEVTEGMFHLDWIEFIVD